MTDGQFASDIQEINETSHIFPTDIEPWQKLKKKQTIKMFVITGRISVKVVLFF